MGTVLAIEHVVTDPKMHNGRPYLAGRGITVDFIAELYNFGWTTDDLMEHYELTPGQVHAALSYYFDHKEQIDQETRERHAQTDALLDELTRKGQAESFADFKRRIEARQAGRK